VLVTLVEDDELDRLGATRLPAWAERRRMEVLRLAIPDAGVPSVDAAHRLVTGIVDALRRGRSVCIHCAAGLGRSGTVAACVLAALGREVVQAVRAVRAARPGAIENPRQFAFVSTFARSLRSRAAPPLPKVSQVKAKVIDLDALKKAKAAYVASIASTRGVLEDLRRQAFGCAVSTACAGPWSEWSAAQPTGSVIAFSKEMLAKSGDPLVTALVAVVTALEDAQEILAKEP
jgi:hypothetical protein